MDKELLIDFIFRVKNNKRITKKINKSLEEADLKDSWKDMELSIVAGKLVEYFNIDPIGIKEHLLAEKKNGWFR